MDFILVQFHKVYFTFFNILIYFYMYLSFY